MAEKNTTRAELRERRMAKSVDKSCSLANVVLQYGDIDISYEKICENVQNAWRESGGIGTLTSLDVYLKPEEHKVYYVTNGGEDTGSIDF